MNREIKFRGRRLDNKEWVYGYFYNMPIRNIVASFILTNDFLEEFEHGTRDYDLGFKLWKNMFPIDKNTIGQFTGLYDKNGHEIYEGDIVYSEFKDGSHTNGLIGWDDETASFGLMDEYSYHSKLQGYDFPKFEVTVLYNFRRHGEKFEVVGNIHNNPELLNGTS